MKKAWVIGACLIGMLWWPGLSSADETYVIDPDHSSITFRIKHLGITFVSGKFPNASGTYTFDDMDLKNASIWIKVRVADIDTGNEKRDLHLRSSDFFDEKQFPFIVFKSVSISASDRGEYLVTGELSLHGVSKEVTVRAAKTTFYRDTGGEYRSGFKTRFSIKRSDFGMQYLSLVSDRVELFVSVEGVRVEEGVSSSVDRDYTFCLSSE